MTGFDGRRYLLGQAERFDWVDLWPRVMAARLQLIEALADVSEEQARWKPPAGLMEGDEDGWSILQVARHVAGWSDYAIANIEASAAGQPSPASLPPRPLPDGATLAEVRRALSEVSMRIASITERLPATPSEDAAIEHERFGALPARAWFAFVRLHDLDHVGQVNGIKAAEGYPS